MARWLVTQGDHQFSANDLTELKELAKTGQVGAGDMVQPPGAADWLYASEVPELAELFPSGGEVDDDDLDWDMPKKRNRTPLVVVLLGIVAFGGYGMWDYGQKLPDHNDLELIGGTSGMTLTEMIASSDVPFERPPMHKGKPWARCRRTASSSCLGSAASGTKSRTTLEPKGTFRRTPLCPRTTSRTPRRGSPTTPSTTPTATSS